MGKFISQKEDISDVFLENIYQVIMNAATQASEQANDEKSKKLLSNIQEIVSQHQQKENKDRQDAENIINNL
jgi:soluble cytochrome b562